MKHPSIKKIAWYTAAGLLTAIIAIGLLGLSVLPGMVRDEAQKYGQRIGYQIDIGQVHIAPLLLKAEATDLKISSVADGELLALKHVMLDIKFWPLFTGELHIETIALDSPQFLLKQLKGKSASWNWVKFIDAVSGPADATPSTLKIAIDQLKIEGAQLTVRQGQRVDHFGPMSFELQGYRNAGEDGQVGGLASDYSLNLGQVRVPIAGADGMPDRQLVLDQVRLSGSAHQKANQDYRINLELLVGAGKLSTRWEIDAESSDVKAQLVVEDVPLAPWIALLPTYQPLQTASGTLNATLDVLMTAKQNSLSGSGVVNNLNIRMSGSDDTLLGLSKAQVDKLSLNLPSAEGQAGTLVIGEVSLTQPVARFEIDAQQVSNFRRLFSRPGAEPAAAPPPPPKSAAPAFRYDVRAIRVQNGLVHFADRSIRPEFVVDINALNGYLLGLSNRPNQYASLALDGRVGKSGSLRGRGQLAFADPRLNHDVSLLFKNIPLKTTNPYSMTFAGYQIDDGRIDVDLRYVTKDGQLQGKNRFVIKKIKLGQEVPDYQGTRLPLGLAVALLEDSDGMIDVNIPVQGNVNDPEFSVGHLVWQAVKTVLNNLVTAPFRAMGALLGIESMDQISFIAGESALLPADQESLEKVANALAKRPGSRVVIQGGYDPAVDAPALARAMADRAILAAAGIQVDASEPLPTPNFSDPAIRAALRSAYGSQVGRIKLGQRLLTLPDTPERDQQLHQELIERFQIGEAQLRQLANERAQHAQRVLLTAAPGLAERVSLGEPEQVSAAGNTVSLVVQIQRN